MRISKGWSRQLAGAGVALTVVLAGVFGQVQAQAAELGASATNTLITGIVKFQAGRVEATTLSMFPQKIKDHILVRQFLPQTRTLLGSWKPTQDTDSLLTIMSAHAKRDLDTVKAVGKELEALTKIADASVRSADAASLQIAWEAIDLLDRFARAQPIQTPDAPTTDGTPQSAAEAAIEAEEAAEEAAENAAEAAAAVDKDGTPVIPVAEPPTTEDLLAELKKLHAKLDTIDGVKALQAKLQPSDPLLATDVGQPLRMCEIQKKDLKPTIVLRRQRACAFQDTASDEAQLAALTDAKAVFEQAVINQTKAVEDRVSQAVAARNEKRRLKAIEDLRFAEREARWRTIDPEVAARERELSLIPIPEVEVVTDKAFEKLVDLREDASKQAEYQAALADAAKAAATEQVNTAKVSLEAVTVKGVPGLVADLTVLMVTAADVKKDPKAAAETLARNKLIPKRDAAILSAIAAFARDIKALDANNGKPAIEAGYSLVSYSLLQLLVALNVDITTPRFEQFRSALTFVAAMMDGAVQGNADAVTAALKAYVRTDDALVALRTPVRYETPEGYGVSRADQGCIAWLFCENTVLIDSTFGAAYAYYDEDGDGRKSAEFRSYGPIGLAYKAALIRGWPITVMVSPIDIGGYITRELKDDDYSAKLSDIVSPSYAITATTPSGTPFRFTLGYQDGVKTAGGESDAVFFSIGYALPFFKAR